jgi:beta-glucosidase
LIGIALLSSCGMAALVAHADTETCEASRWPAPSAPPSVDPATEAFVNRLLSQMTLEEKVGQMIQADIDSVTPADLHDVRLGSILAGGNAAPGGNVRTTPQAWLDLVNAFGSAAKDADASRHPPIPILFGIDAVHGDAKIVGATIFPHNVGLGAAHDPDLIRRIGMATAEEVASTGIDWTFAPTVAVARDPRWGRAYESYSADPQLVADYAAAMVSGLQGVLGSAEFLTPGHTLASVKHFLGDGATRDGRDQGEDVVSAAQLREVDGLPYEAAIGAGAMIVMASYNSWGGTKLHANHCLLTDVLKERLGFRGFVVGDWNAHEQIPGCTKTSCPAAILAGIDMLMAPDGWRQLYVNTLRQVRDGVIPEARIDDAVTRILRVKTLSGAFSRALPRDRPDAGDFAARLGSPAHRALAREAVRRSLVLLKNNHETLPLSPGGHYLLVGPSADDIGFAAGGWTIDWQGDHNINADFPGATSIYAGIEHAVLAAGGSVGRSAYGEFERKPDAAIVVFGEGPYAEFQGDRETLAYAPGDARALAGMRRLRAAHIPVVAVFLSGRPLWVNPQLNAADAFVAAWLPGSEGEGIADLLFRSPDGGPGFDFQGKLGFPWPATAMPVAYDPAGKARDALFPRGYGLSYAQPATLARLPELPHIPPARRARDTLFADAHVTAPWSVFVADHADQVRLTTAEQRSPHGAVDVKLDKGALIATWDGTQAGSLLVSGRAADLRTAAAGGFALAVRYRVTGRPDAAVRVGIRCAAPYRREPGPPPDPATASAACGVPSGATVDLGALFRSADPAPGAGRETAWRTLTLPLACWSGMQADLSAVDVPLAIETTGRLALEIGDIRYLRAAAGSGCPVAKLQQPGAGATVR